MALDTVDEEGLSLFLDNNTSSDDNVIPFNRDN